MLANSDPTNWWRPAMFAAEPYGQDCQAVLQPGDTESSFCGTYRNQQEKISCITEISLRLGWQSVGHNQMSLARPEQTQQRTVNISQWNTRSQQYIMMVKWFNKHYCEVKLQNKRKQYWNLSTWEHTNILSFSLSMNGLNNSEVRNGMEWNTDCRQQRSRGTWIRTIKERFLDKKITGLLSMMYNINRLCCKPFRRDFR